MILKLSLAKDQFVWALSNPLDRGYIHESSRIGHQDCNLIISQADDQPVEIVLEDYPKWAQTMILSSVRTGQLINVGDSIDVKEKPAETPKKVETVGTKKKTTKKKTNRRSNK